MTSFARLATQAASTKRGGIDGNGHAIAPAESIASLLCLPLMAVDPRLAQAVRGLAWYEMLMTAVEGGLDIVEGDILVVGSTEYSISAVADWPWRPTGEDRLILYLEDKK